MRAEDPFAARLFLRVEAFLLRFVAYPSPHAAVAHVLWIAHAHCMEAWESTPRIAFLSAEKESGKTRALEITELVVPRPVQAVNVTPAYLFRKVGDPEGAPTVLFDEIDTVFGPKAKDNEEIRGLLNAGHRRGAVAGRCAVRGKVVVTEEIPAFCALAVAGIGDIPDTILSRSVLIKMRRRKSDERVESYRRRLHAAEGRALHDELEAWATHAAGELKNAWPSMPSGIEDRAADVWEPLLAVADYAGGVWPSRARAAAVALVSVLAEDTPSLGVRLLQNLQTIFGSSLTKTTAAILEELAALPESPWDDIRGKPLNDRGLANRLRQYGIRPKTIRIGDSTPRGYDRADFEDAWARYCPPATLQKFKTSETPKTAADVSDVAAVLNLAAEGGEVCPDCAGEGCGWCRPGARA